MYLLWGTGTVKTKNYSTIYTIYHERDLKNVRTLSGIGFITLRAIRPRHSHLTLKLINLFSLMNEIILILTFVRSPKKFTFSSFVAMAIVTISVLPNFFQPEIQLSTLLTEKISRHQVVPSLTD